MKPLTAILLLCAALLPACITMRKSPSEQVFGHSSPAYDDGYIHGYWDGINTPFVKR